MCSEDPLCGLLSLSLPARYTSHLTPYTLQADGTLYLTLYTLQAEGTLYLTLYTLQAEGTLYLTPCRLTEKVIKIIPLSYQVKIRCDKASELEK